MLGTDSWAPEAGLRSRRQCSGGTGGGVNGSGGDLGVPNKEIRGSGRAWAAVLIRTERERPGKSKLESATAGHWKSFCSSSSSSSHFLTHPKIFSPQSPLRGGEWRWFERTHFSDELRNRGGGRIDPLPPPSALHIRESRRAVFPCSDERERKWRCGSPQNQGSRQSSSGSRQAVGSFNPWDCRRPRRAGFCRGERGREREPICEL